MNNSEASESCTDVVLDGLGTRRGMRCGFRESLGSSEYQGSLCEPPTPTPVMDNGAIA